jgi:hypothetical protein
MFAPKIESDRYQIEKGEPHPLSAVTVFSQRASAVELLFAGNRNRII